MRSKFDEQLVELNNEMIKMGAMIETAITNAVKALSQADEELAKKIMAADIEVDQEEKKIEDICFNLLIQQQPVARDLHTITAAMKMVTDMERIGDHAADISEITLLLCKANKERQEEKCVKGAGFEHINKMSVETMLMLNKSIEAYIERDSKKANEVIAHDDIVDDLFSEAKADIIRLILDKPSDGEEATDLLMVAKYFERIGDHATNIAEWVIYSLKTSEE